MLKSIPSLLYPDLLHALASMGHGDTITVVDRNFPAASVASETVLGRPLFVGVDALQAVEAILTVFPIDTYNLEVAPVQGMQIVDAPHDVPAVVAAAAPLFELVGASITLVERFAFYETAKASFAILRTTEDRPYGNFILRKGVVSD